MGGRKGGLAAVQGAALGFGGSKAGQGVSVGGLGLVLWGWKSARVGGGEE